MAVGQEGTTDMNIKRTYCSDTLPDEFGVTVIGDVSALLTYSTAEGEEGNYIVTEVADPAPHPAYYGTLVEALIALRYTPGAEIALNRLPDDDPEKIEYLAFVERAKQAVKAVL